MIDLRGLAALVTGSDQGIGFCIAKELARAGASVALHGLRPSSDSEELIRKLVVEGLDVRILHGDLGSQAETTTLYEHAVEQLGRIDILVLNASEQTRKNWLAVDCEDLDRIFAVNMKSSVRLMQLAIPPMAERGWGRVLAIGSHQQTVPHPQMLAYAASKSAQYNIVRNLAKQYAAYGVTVNNISPGTILTDRNADVLKDERYRAKVIRSIPAGRLGAPEDCAAAALLLCSGASAYISGVDLIVDGGAHLDSAY